MVAPSGTRDRRLFAARPFEANAPSGLHGVCRATAQERAPPDRDDGRPPEPVPTSRGSAWRRPACRADRAGTVHRGPPTAARAVPLPSAPSACPVISRGLPPDIPEDIAPRPPFAPMPPSGPRGARNVLILRRRGGTQKSMQPRSGGRPSALESVLRSELARRRIEARRAEQRVERELSRTVHDLKAPLSALKGYVDMMLRGIAGPMPPTANRYLTRIREVVDRERQLIDDRLRPRSHPAPPPMTDLARALAAAVDRSGPALRARRLQLSLELPPRGCPVPASQGLVDLLARRLGLPLPPGRPRPPVPRALSRGRFGDLRRRGPPDRPRRRGAPGRTPHLRPRPADRASARD